MKNIRIRRFIETSEESVSGLTEYMWARLLEWRILYEIKRKKRKRALYRKYLIFMKKSADLGYPEAQYRMGLAYAEIYTLGYSNPDEDEERQLFWFKKACDNDISGACNRLAIIYEQRGLIDDAIRTYNKAIALGDGVAAENLSTLKIPSDTSDE